MKKLIVGGLIILLAMGISFAGDSAVFVDYGFSKDGNYYIFGQYGKTDRNFQGWAEIYTVDVAKNDFVDKGIFTVKPSKSTEGKSGKNLYETLFEKNSSEIKKYSCSPAGADCVLYIREAEHKKSFDEIVFKDFTGSISSDCARYSVRLLSEMTGCGATAKSSFVIMLEKQDENGKVVARQKIGSPKIRRTGVTAYKIEKIVCDDSGKNIVFIVEKTVEDKTGTNIRYMIETASLIDDFYVNLVNKE